MGQITVFSGPERRRRWNDEERVRILAEAFAPGACVADVARRCDVSTSLVYTWRRKFGQRHLDPGFAEAIIADEPRGDVSPEVAAIVIDLPGGGRVSILASAPPSLAAAALQALR